MTMLQPGREIPSPDHFRKREDGREKNTPELKEKSSPRRFCSKNFLLSYLCFMPICLHRSGFQNQLSSSRFSLHSFPPFLFFFARIPHAPPLRYEAPPPLPLSSEMRRRRLRPTGLTNEAHFKTFRLLLLYPAARRYGFHQLASPPSSTRQTGLNFLLQSSSLLFESHTE